MHVEYIVLGSPASNQSAAVVLRPWRSAVEAEVRRRWTGPPLASELKVIIIHFYAGDAPPLDVDNMAKPILDVMQGVVYQTDRQVRQAELAHVRIYAEFGFVKASKLIANAIQAGAPFVFVRVSDAVDPFPLPKEVS